MTATNNIYSYSKYENGEANFTDTRTGEVLKAVNVNVPEGTITRTPAEQEAIKLYYDKKKSEEEKWKHNAIIKKELGNFYFIPLHESFSDISPQSAARLIFLATFGNYKGDLINSRGVCIKYSDLSGLLKLSKSEVSMFAKEVCQKRYLVINEKREIKLNTDVFFKGTLKNKAKSKEDFYQRFYIKHIQRLYYKTTPSKHKNLGYIYKLLPFINIQNNIICDNPFEEDIDKVHMMTLKEFCEMIDYDYSNVNRLLRVYKDILFDVKYGSEVHKERFVSFVFDGLDKSKAKIIINPHIIYGGSDYNSVYKLGSFCKV